MSTPARRNKPKGLLSRILIFPLRCLIRAYQGLIAPHLPQTCRYMPSCSQYALMALEERGLLKGGGLALRRLGRCHPLGGSGYDPVPSPPGSEPAKKNPLPAQEEGVLLQD